MLIVVLLHLNLHFCVWNILSHLLKHVLFCSLHPLNCLTAVSSTLFLSSLQSAVIHCKTKHLQCREDCLLKMGKLINGLNDVSKRNSISGRYQPSGLFVAPLVALSSMWLFSGVIFVCVFFFTDVWTKGQELDVVPVNWGEVGCFVFFFFWL